MNQDPKLQNLDSLSSRATLLEEYVGFLTDGLRKPIRCEDEEGGFFRFPAPDVRHYCLLQMSSVVGALSAAIHLARGGFWVEVCVLMRIVIEATTHIDWMLHSQDGSETDKRKSAEYLEKYLADSDRNEISDSDPVIKQREVHRIIAENIDQQIKEHGLSAKPAAELLFTTYKRYSYYIHNRYPELMDRYDGFRRRFTLAGDRNPHKDRENFEIIETYLDTATLCAKHIAIRFQLGEKLIAHPRLRGIMEFALGEP